MPKRVHNADLGSPTPERMRHGTVTLLDRPIIADGSFNPPRLVVDLLSRMQEAGKISQDERIAGERFRDWFRFAQLDDLRAADMARPYVDGGGAIPGLQPRHENARREILNAIRWVGGMRSSEASCLWHVIGLDQSLRKWAIEQSETVRRIDHKGASVILAIALERLARMPWRGPHEDMK